jgi:hypothetical protein
MEPKIERLLAEFEFTTITAVHPDPSRAQPPVAAAATEATATA